MKNAIKTFFTFLGIIIGEQLHYVIGICLLLVVLAMVIFPFLIPVILIPIMIGFVLLLCILAIHSLCLYVSKTWKDAKHEVLLKETIKEIKKVTNLVKEGNK